MINLMGSNQKGRIQDDSNNDVQSLVRLADKHIVGQDQGNDRTFHFDHVEPSRQLVTGAQKIALDMET